MKTKEPLSRSAVESRGIISGTIVAVVGFGSVLLVKAIIPNQPVNVSLFGLLLAIGVAVVSFVGFFCGFRYNEITEYQKPRRALGKWSLKIRRSLSFFSLGFAYAAIGFLATLALTNILDKSISLQLDYSIMASISALILGVCTYLSFTKAANMKAKSLAGLLMVFMLSGSATSILMAENPYWWQDHFSALGAGGSLSSYAFNFTLIIAGFLLILLADFITDSFQKIQRLDSERTKNIKANIVRIMLMVVGFCMIGVGIFPYDQFLIAHNTCANSMTLIFGALVVLLPWLAPIFSKAFVFLSYLTVVFMIASYVLVYGEGKITVFVLELTIAAAVFCWLAVFMQQINAIHVDRASKKLRDHIAAEDRAKEVAKKA